MALAILFAHVSPSEGAPLLYQEASHLLFRSAPSVIQTGSFVPVMAEFGSPVYIWLVRRPRYFSIPAEIRRPATVLALPQPIVSQHVILTWLSRPADCSVAERVGRKDVTSTGLLTLISIEE